MKPKFCVEVFNDDGDKLINAAKDLGYECISLQNTIAKDYSKLYSTEECVVFHGSLEFANELLRKSKWIPGPLYYPDRMRCSYYYPRLYKYLLNKHHVFLPFGEIQHKANWLFDIFGSPLFIRPDSGFKIFTGSLVHKNCCTKNLQKLHTYNIDPTTMCLISNFKQIKKEYRFFIANSQIVDGSIYMINGELATSPIDLDTTLIDYVNLVINSYEEKNYVLDIALTDKPHVLEINSFSCSGIYFNNPNQIIESGAQIATKEWLELQE